MTDELYTLKSTGQVIEDPHMSSIMWWLIGNQPHCNINYTWDDIGMAQLLVDCYKSEIRYCYQNGCWYTWAGCWRKQKDSGVVTDMFQTMLNLLNLYPREVLTDENADTLEEYAKYIKSVRKFTSIRNILELCKSLCRMSITDMDTNPYLLNTPRMAYDLRNGEHIYDITPFNVTKLTTCNLPDQTTVPCKRWYQFIDEIMSHNPDKISFLQRALGYSLLGVNREECMFMAYGSRTRNGKGTLFSTINTVLGEDYADNASTELICEGKNGKKTDFNAPQPSLVKLVGARIVSMSEAPKEDRLDAANMKTITGRDTLVARGLYESAFSFVPGFTLWLNTNYLPEVTDETVFSSNRIWVIEFSEHFEGAAQDKDLKEFFAKPENRPTILQWLYDGCLAYMREGLNPPKCVIDATAAYRVLHDRIGNFIRENLVTGDFSTTCPCSAIYGAYTSWCVKPDNRYKPLGSSRFYAELTGRGYPIMHTEIGNVIHGLTLKSSTPATSKTAETATPKNTGVKLSK